MPYFSKCNDLSIGFWNVDGIFEGSGKLKTCKLYNQSVQSNLSKFDIICLVEIHCGPDATLGLDGYRTFYNCRNKNSVNNRYYGGISVLIKNNLLYGVKVLPSKSSEIQWIKLLKSNFDFDEDIYVCTVYIAPYNSNYTCNCDDDIFSILESDIINYSSVGKCLIFGDFNARTSIAFDYLTDDNLDKHLNISSNLSNCLQLGRYNSDPAKINEHGKKLLSLCKSSGLRILNGRVFGDSTGQPTCFSHNGAPSVIDYALASEDLFQSINCFHVDNPSPSSIHCVLSTVLNINMDRKDDSNIILDPLPAKFIWREQDSLNFRNAITSTDIQNKIKHFLDKKMGSDKNEINSSVNDINDILYTTAHFAGVKKSKSRKQTHQSKKQPKKQGKWFDIDCHLALRNLNKLGNELRRDPYNQLLLKTYRHNRKKYKSVVKKKKLSFQNKLLDKLISLEGEQPKVFWKLFDELNSFNKKSRSNPIQAEVWVQHFQDTMSKFCVNQGGNKEILEFIKNNSNSNFNELNFKITADEISKAIPKLKNGKSCGNDLILNEMLKSANPVIIPLLVKLFNQILTNSTYPDAWRVNFITPLHKKGPINSPENYRGIAVSSNLSKLFCSVLHNRLSKFFADNNVIPNNQIGYRSKARTSDHIYTLKCLIDKYTKHLSKHNLYCCFVDFKSAFDSLWRDALIFKLIRANVCGNYLHTIRDMYSEVLYSIKLENGLTPAFSTKVGVKQGCVLSPKSNPV
jgi:hypothetical protein